MCGLGGMDTSLPAKRTRPRSQDNRTPTAFPISDERWAVLEPWLPVPVKTHRFGGGRPRVAARDGADALFYVLRTGGQWSALKQTTLCAPSTAPDRFQEGVAAGVCLRWWQTGVEPFDELRGIDWNGLRRDGAITKAPLGGEKNRPQPDGSWQAGRPAERTDGGSRGAP